MKTAQKLIILSMFPMMVLFQNCTKFSSTEPVTSDTGTPQPPENPLPTPTDETLGHDISDYYFPSPDKASSESDDAWESKSAESGGWSTDGLNQVVNFLQTPMPGSSVPADCGTNTTALIVLHKGKIIKEWYNPNVGSTKWNKCKFYAIDQKLPLSQVWSKTTQSDIYSATKSIISTLVGIQIGQGRIKSIEEPVSYYLGDNWTCFSKELIPGTNQSKYTAEQALKLEKSITIKNLIDMTSGIGGSGKGDYGFYPYFVTEPGKVWVYNTNAYHQLYNVIAASNGMVPPKVDCDMPKDTYVEKVFDINAIAKNSLFDRIGMKHTVFNSSTAEWERLKWVVSSPRDMARFGHLILSQGHWGIDGKLESIYDSKLPFFKQLTNSSFDLSGQTIDPIYANPSYGFLWWLNGKSEAKLSGIDFQACYVYEKTGANIGLGDKPSGELPADLGTCNSKLPILVPSAPSDMFAALGGLDKKIYVVPSLDLVVVRHGGAADNFTLASTDFDDELWKAIMKAKLAP